MSNSALVSKKFLLIFLFLFLSLFIPITASLVTRVNAVSSATTASLSISDSRAGATSVTYVFSFTATQSAGIKQVDLQMCTTASGTCTAPTGFGVGATNLQSNSIEGTTFTTSGPSANHYRITIGTTVTQSPLSTSMTFTGTTNPTTINTTFFGRITTYSDAGITVLDTAVVAAATLNTTSLAVSASIDPTLSFSIAGVGLSANVDAGSGPKTTVITTATSIPFGTVVTGSTNIAAHDVTIITNAGSGFTVSLKTLADPPLVSGSYNIDKFCGETANTCVNTSPQSWSTPAGAVANANTGYFGYTTNDSTLCTFTAARFTSGGPKFAGPETIPYEVDCNPAGVITETKRLGWRMEVNGAQPAGSYTGTIILVATPTY